MNKYLKADNTSAEVYEKRDKGQFYNPSNLGHADFARLILVIIDDHPEIKTVELVAPTINSTPTILVILWFEFILSSLFIDSISPLTVTNYLLIQRSTLLCSHMKKFNRSDV